MRRRALLCAVPLATSASTARADLTADAVSAATSLNPVIGVITWLFDGQTPPTDPAAGAVEWGGAGLLRVTWPRPVMLARIRVYLGLMERYTVYGYQGGGFSDTGQRVDVEEPVWTTSGLAPLETDRWFDIPCKPGIAVDNIGLSMVGRTVIYEMQFLGPDGTVIAPASFALIKAGAPR